MTSVDILKELLKERKIPVSKLEKDLGYGNGYISGLRKGTLPAERLFEIANYLEVDASYFIEAEKEKPLVNNDEELTEYLEMLKTRPETKMLFQLAKNATKEDVEKAVKIIEALKGND